MYNDEIEGYVLKPKEDKAARAALLFYADNISDVELADEIREEIAEIEMLEILHLGDEIEFEDYMEHGTDKKIWRGCVVEITEDPQIFVLRSDCHIRGIEFKTIKKKTGRHFDNIDGIIRQMQEDGI